MAIKIIVADDVKEMRETIGKMLEASDLVYEIVAFCENGVEVIHQLEKKNADIVLMDINMPVQNGLETTAIIADKFPRVQVIMMSVQHESEYLKKAMISGAKAYIMKPVDLNELVETIETTYNRYQSSLPHIQPVEEKNGKIATFYSAKGGVGKSFLALNMAILLNQKFNQKVALVDLDLRFGDIALMVNKHNETTLKELVEDNSMASFEDIEPFTHTLEGGVDLIFAPQNPEAAEDITKDHVTKLLKLLRKRYDWIFIDTAVNFDEITLVALDLSDRLLMVSNQEVAGIKNTKVALNVMKNLDYDVSKIKILINMSEEKYGVKSTSVKKAFDYDVIGFIPETPKYVRVAANTGVPIAFTKNSVVKNLVKICETLIKEG